MPRSTDRKSAAAGCAALSICESQLLALDERRILTKSDVRGILEDAAATHRGAAATAAEDPALHELAAEMIERLLDTSRATHESG